jgi:HD-like signal output (HDOD) protein
MRHVAEGRVSFTEARLCIERLYDLPPMPDTGRALLELRAGPDATAADLAAILERDAALAAQLIGYARLPLFGYRGSLDCVHDAITRVLGPGNTLHICLGLAVGRALRGVPQGPFGQRAFWRHAIYSAALTQALAQAMPPARRPALGLACLAALLHNFGLLLFCHLFPPEFSLLNKLAAANPHTPIGLLERHLIGMGQAQSVLTMGHARLGAWLMESWGMPEEVVVSVGEHHNPTYRSRHFEYSSLVLIADHLLKRHRALGDGETAFPQADLLASLGLRPEDLASVGDRLSAHCCAGLDAMADQIAA